MNEAFSGFENIGHNDLFTLVFLWIIPKYVSLSHFTFRQLLMMSSGLWIIFPSYNIYVMGSEIAATLENASIKGKRSKSS